MYLSLAPIAARLLLLACGTLTVPAALAAGIGEIPAGGRDARSGERSARLQEMRRQLLEHQQQWQNGSTIERAAPPPGGLAPSGAGPLGSGLHETPPMTGAAAQAPALPAAPLAPRTLGILPPIAPSTPAPADDYRLSDRERSLLRQQLRQLPPLR